MTPIEADALTLATQHAMTAGVPEPWTWATENAADFIDQAAIPWTQEELEQERREAVEELETLGALGGILVGPPPTINAGADAHAAYACALLDALGE